ncbi:MAG: hypothetical protein IPP12_06855 [Nitrospira sp.]|nr:hypothetical protein [Nitrospira sp.]
MLSRIISSRHSPHLLFLGYPDLLTDEASWPLQSVTWHDAPKRRNTGRVWAGHGRAHIKNYPMVETKGLFQSLGCEVTVADAIRRGNEDVVMDLNHPAPENMCGRFDIIIDPGTLEHCFNIAQAFDNIDRMLCVAVLSITRTR